jgi:Leucine-rich repeat (LRR) protein
VELEKLSHLDLSDNLLTELKSDLLTATNNIREFYARNNNLTKIDVYFIWRLKTCFKIDFQGNPRNENCKLEFDSSDGKNFDDFFNDFVELC